MDNEAELFQLVAKGDAAAFQLIFHHYNALLYLFVVKMTGSPETAKEVVQDIFLLVWQQREKLPAIQYPKAWIYRVASNTAVNYLRKQAADGRLFDRLKTQSSSIAATPETSLLTKETDKILQQAIQSLPPGRQQVYRLSREQNLTIPEIAVLLGLSPHTVKNQLVSALKSIKSFLEQHLPVLAGCCIIFL